MSLTIPPTKSVTGTISSSREHSPLRSTPVLKHMSTGSLSEINLSPLPIHERAIASPSSLSSLEEVAGLDDANATFLTLIAFQERRVVELREELARAESELDLLKQQWTRQQLNLTRSIRQEHIRQDSLTKLEQIVNGTAYGTSRTMQDEIMQSPQILAAGKRLAEGVRDGIFTVLEDLKAVAVNESAQVNPRRRGRSPTRVMRREEEGLGIVAEKVEPRMWYPRGSSPAKRVSRRGSDGSDSTHETTSLNTTYPPFLCRVDLVPHVPPQ